MFKRVLYHIYRIDYLFQQWRTRKFTTGGILLLIVLIASAVIGLDTRRTVVYKGFSFFLALFALSFVWSLFFRIRLTAKRILPKFGTVEERLEYRIVVQNRSQKSQKDFYLFENLEDPRPTLEEFLHTPEPGEEVRNAYDQTLLFYRWQWLISKKQGVRVKEQPLPTLPPNDDGEVRAEIVPERRGYIQLAGLTIARPDPLNLYKAFIRIPLQQSILVLPKRYSLPPIYLPGTRKFKLGGITLASSVGESGEFVSLRDYRPGDPLRQIHWKSWAKTGKPIVKEYQEEYFVRHALILDTFQETAYSEMFEEAVSIAASFACTVRTQDSLLDLMFVGTEAYCFTSGRGLAHTDQMLELLASVTTCRDKPFNTLPPLVIEHTPLLSGCICILLSWGKERKDFIGHLRNLDVPLLVFVITDGKTSQSLAPGPMQDMPENFHTLEVGKIQEGLARLSAL
jgi:uncharacterized protein (DUF58 family)